MLFSIKTVIFDLDDTLLHCDKYYVERIERFAQAKSEYTGLSPEMCKNMLKATDTVLRPEFGVGLSRFPIHFKSVSAMLDVVAQKEINIEQANMLHDDAASVFDCLYEPFDDTIETLDKIQMSGTDMILYTLGDNGCQKRKVESNDLGKYFSKIYYVEQKNHDSFNTILDENNLNPNTTLMVGDNFEGEIVPAYDARTHSAYIDRRAGARWIREQMALERISIPIRSLDELFDNYIFGEFSGAAHQNKIPV